MQIHQRVGNGVDMIHDRTGFAENPGGLAGLGGMTLNQQKAHGVQFPGK
jgi:hypothetical protein